LWPKFEDPQVGLMLAFTGAVKEDVLDVEDLAARLMLLLWQRYPDKVKERYGIDCEPDAPAWELLEAAGRKRGYLMARGEINLERMAKVLLDEFRSGKLGRFTLEEPEEQING
jgi:ribosome biogenesis GTPase A